MWTIESTPVIKLVLVDLQFDIFLDHYKIDLELFVSFSLFTTLNYQTHIWVYLVAILE